MDLPDNLNLENDEKSDEEEEGEGTSEKSLYRFLDESQMETGGNRQIMTLFSIEKERGGGRIVYNKKLHIHFCVSKYKHTKYRPDNN